MLGSQVMRTAPRDVAAVATTLADTDLADAAAVEALFDRVRPEGVVHTAGFTDVDGAESAKEAAHRDNVVATGLVAEACAGRKIPLVTVSTDYVFNGRADGPYTEDDEPDPQSVYGRTKLAAERAAGAARI
ncbi:MAG: SDR family oxidoreductase, partial [Planctomycetota bacterium]